MKPKLIIFDVDGLIINTEYIWEEAHEIIAEKYNEPKFGKELFQRTVGLNGSDHDRAVREELKGFTNIDELYENIRIIGTKLLQEKLALLPGFHELINVINSKHILKAVATATPRSLTEERLSKLGVIDEFNYILCGNEVTKRKPDPEIYLTVLDYFKCSPKEALVLEDSPTGVEAAYRAKIPVIMIPSVVKPALKQENETIAIVNDLKEVIQYIE